jgi:23S rRNA pseudouridine2605 synthase
MTDNHDTDQPDKPAQDPDQARARPDGDTPDAASSAERPKRRRGPRKSVEAQAQAEPGGEAVEPTARSDDLESAPVGIDGAMAAPVEGELRRSRRNRRRGRKGRAGRDADGVAVDGSGAADQPGSDLSQPPRPDARELFDTVTSGAFDVEADALPEQMLSDEAPPAEGLLGAPVDIDPSIAPTDAPPPRRVLAPDVEAPKLQKVLAQAGVGSRRDLEQMISENRVTVNNKPAHTGQRVSWGDQVAVDGKPVKVRIAPLPARVIAYHKPAGEVVTHDDPQQRPTVFRRLPRLAHGKWQSVGRLDINTEGLLLFTTSGELANQLMHPRFGVEREYAVRVLGLLDPEGRARLLEGVTIEGQSAAFQSIEDGGGEGANHWYRVVITEGRNREVRKLFDAVGLTVNRLIRIRYGSIVLPRGLKRGVWVDLAEADVKLLRQLTGLGDGGRSSGPRGRGGNAQIGERQGGRQGERQGERQGDRQAGRPSGPPRPGPRNEAARRERQPVRERAPQGPQRGRARNKLHEGFGDAALHARDSDVSDDGDDHDHAAVVNIPNPLQQTFDQRAIRESRNARRELSDDAPIPNPLQQTYDKRALKETRGPRREPGDDDPIPNPLQQTYDQRFVQGTPRGRGHVGGRGKAGARPTGGQPDPLKTAVGYIGGDAFLRKKDGGRGGKGGGGRRGGGRCGPGR